MLYQKVLKPPSQTVKNFNSFNNNILSYRQSDLQKHVALKKAFVGISLHSENLQNNFATYEGMRVKNSQPSDINHFNDNSRSRTHVKLPAFNTPNEIGVKCSNEDQITIADKNVIGNITYRLAGEDGAPDTIIMELFLDAFDGLEAEYNSFTHYDGNEKSIEDVAEHNDVEQLDNDENCNDEEISDTEVVDSIYDVEITAPAEPYSFDANDNLNDLNIDVEYSAVIEDIAIDTYSGVDNELKSLVDDSDNDLNDKDNLLDEEDFEDLDTDEDTDNNFELDDEVAESETRVASETENDTKGFAELMDRWSIFSTSRSSSDDREPESHNEVEEKHQNNTAIKNNLDLPILEETLSDNSLIEIAQDDQIAPKRRSF